jgi:glutamate racemase
MKIGLFDSGLGGLIVARAIRKAMPQYDYVYLGDTARVPYGNRSHEAVFQFTKECVDHLFRNEKCALVVVACNTASARALGELQREYRGMDKKVLGVLIPAAEEAAKFEKIGILATAGAVASGAFPVEINKLKKDAKVFQNPAPLLVPLAENGEKNNALPFLKKYLSPFKNKKLDALVLGCTHYPLYKKEIRKLLPKNVRIISQDEIVPRKLKRYLAGHPEIVKKLSKKGTAKILVTDETQTVDKLTSKWFGKVKPKLISLS